MEEPTPPEKPDWIDGLLEEQWFLGREDALRAKVNGELDSMVFPAVARDDRWRRARVLSTLAWVKYYRELDDAQN